MNNPTEVQALNGANDPVDKTTRRSVVTTLLMGVGLAAGYGLGLWHFFRYLVPLGRRTASREMFVGTLADIAVGASLTVRDPRGREINIVRTGDDADNPAQGFKALSSQCPHLGCAVHWEAANNRFFCPCHEGVFDKQGIAQSGPPAAENKNLANYEMRVDAASGWVFVMVTEEARYGV